MKNLLYLPLLLLIVSCSEQASQQKESNSFLPAPDDVRSLGLFSGTDNFEYVSNEDSVSFKYGDIKISKIPNKEDVGEVIHVYKNNQYFDIKGDAAYFKGLVGKLMIIEESTSAVSLLRVIDLNDMNEILSESAMDLTLEENTLNFVQKVEIEDPSKQPVCPEELMENPDQIGFVEMVSYDLAAKKLVRSGQFECQYFE